MALPLGAKYVYKALGLTVPDGDGEGSPFPPSQFADETQLAAIELAGEYACAFNLDGTPNLEGNDLLLYDAALGYLTASKVAGNPSAPGVGGPVMVERKFADVVYKFKAVDVGDSAEAWETLAHRYMGGVSCVNGGVTDLSAVGGLLKVARGNTDDYGRLTDNRGRPY